MFWLRRFQILVWLAILSASLSSALTLDGQFSKPLENYEWTDHGDERSRDTADDGTSSSSAELDRFVEKETEKLIKADGGCPKIDQGISRYMDKLALQVAHESVQSADADRFQEQLARAINLAEIIPDKNLRDHRLKASKAKHSAFALSKGIFEALESADHNVVQNDRKLSDIGRAKLAEFAVSGMTTPEKFKTIEMFFASHSAATQRIKDNLWQYRPEMYEPKKEVKPANHHEASAFQKRMETAMQFLFKALKVSIFLIDNFYLSAVFLDKLPIIGECVQELQRKGEPIHNVIQTVRTFRAAMEMDRSLRGKSASGLAGSSLPMADETQKMLSEVGMDALQMVSSKLVRKYSNVEIEHKSMVEILSRVAYYLLTQFAPKSTHCLLASV